MPGFFAEIQKSTLLCDQPICNIFPVMLDLGFVSAILPTYSLEEVMTFAAQHGFSCVEVMCWPRGKAERRYAGVTHLDMDQFDEATMDRVKQLQDQHGVYISGLGYYPNPLDPDADSSNLYLHHIHQIIRAAARLGIPVVNTFIGRNPATSIEENLEVFAETWRPTIQLAGELGVKIGIENCPMLFTKDEWPGGKNLAISPAIWDQMFEIFPDPHFGLNYDPSHLVWMHMDEVQPIYDYPDRLHHIHLKDVKVYQDKLNRYGILAYPLQFYSPKIPGLGDVRWGAFFSALTSVHYRGPVCIEVEDKAFEGSEADIHKAILSSRNYIRQFVPE